MKPVSIIGMGVSPEDLTASHLRVLQAAEVLVGGRRLLSLFDDHPAEKKEIKKNLKEILEYVQTQRKDKQVVVLASGDPLFFGIGAFLSRHIGTEEVVVYPNISSIAAAFARIKESWNDAALVSLHGRSADRELATVLRRHDKVAVLTDPTHNPQWLATYLDRLGLAAVRMCVLECLGSDQERFQWCTPAEAGRMTFAEPNVVIIKRAEPGVSGMPGQVVIGAPDDWYTHQKGLITKAEVRAVTLSKLRLGDGQILWDLGAGSGSVAIEASTFIKAGQIYAVEKDARRIRQIEMNRDRFGIGNLGIVQATLPDGLENLPQPDRIFIGGGGKRLGGIIETAAARLAAGGIMVINTVLIKNLDVAVETFKQCDLNTELIQVQISRGRAMPWDQRLEAQNPVWIVTGSKK
jgi:precorrin-6Y C5,15-methyltransferase (decarboxylating)